MPALVEITFPRVRGARAVRAAFEGAPAGPGHRLGPLPRPVRRRALPRLRRRANFLASLGRVSTAEALSAVTVGAASRSGACGGLVDPYPEEWQARAGAERAEAARRAEEDIASRGGTAARSRWRERPRSTVKPRCATGRTPRGRALESARAAEADWRTVREGNGDAERPEVRTTEHKFPAGTPARETSPEFGAPPPSAPPSSSSTRSRRTCLRSSLLPRSRSTSRCRCSPAPRSRRSRPRCPAPTRWGLAGRVLAG